jgi:hypothetical protein
LHHYSSTESCSYKRNKNKKRKEEKKLFSLKEKETKNTQLGTKRTSEKERDCIEEQHNDFVLLSLSWCMLIFGIGRF